jgi:7-alpha-hydroxysteroid dehydrogenase
MGSLDGTSVIVTGGGTGIGAACAKLAAAEGATVTICGRTEERLVNVAKAVGATGGSIHHVVADVSNEADVARVVASAVAFGGGLNGFVANAGGGGGLGPYHVQDTQEYIRVLHLNVVGTMLCVKHAVPHLVAAGGGSFIGMSSLAGYVTHLWFGAYPAAKAGIEAMMRNAADEYGPMHVRFNTIRPGFIATEIMEGIQRGGPVWNSYVEQTPMEGVGEPGDVAHLARFLLSDESKWITGQSIAVDGGHGLRRGPDFTSLVELMLGTDKLRCEEPIGSPTAEPPRNVTSAARRP